MLLGGPQGPGTIREHPYMSKVEPPVEQPVMEYGSVTLTIDHSRHTRMQEDGENALEHIFSNFSASEQLLKQIDYFANTTKEGQNLLRLPSVVAVLARFGEDPSTIWLYNPSTRLSNIILSTETYGDFCDEFGGIYEADAAILALATGMTLDCQAKGINTVLVPIVVGHDASRPTVISPAEVLADPMSDPIAKLAAQLVSQGEEAFAG